MKTGFVFDDAFLQHDTGQGHPESASRLASVLSYLNDQPWKQNLIPVEAQKNDRRWLECIHSGDYINRVKTACAQHQKTMDTPDVRISDASWDAALLASGGVIALADQIMTEKLNNGFALVRPPGHHAEYDQALGFCLFNSVAITARYLQRQYGVEKVLILDWDVHHGNGSQHSFESDPSVMYVSLHQYPHYPGTGAYSDTGIGPGVGATLNCPMAGGAGDGDYEQAFRQKILPAINRFSPQAVIISAGFDAHSLDPLGDIRLSTNCFRWMSQRMMEIADLYAGGKLISVLEGGYHLQALAQCVGVHLTTLMNIQPTEP